MNIDEKIISPKDTEYEEVTLKSVEGGEEGEDWELSTEIGCISCPKISDFVPKAGDTVRFYGKGFGYVVRGIVIEGVIHHYLTVEEQEQKHKDWREQSKKNNIEKYEKNKSKYKEDYESLPPLLKDRMDHLYKENPDDRFDWEGYELFIMTQAALIYDTLKTTEKVEEFKLAEYDTQKAMVPELDDGHSGNTFGGACFYASCLAKKAENEEIK